MSVLSGQIATAEDHRRATRKRVARGRRVTTGTATATEIGVLRLDGVSVKAGRTYTIKTNSLQPFSTVANDYVAVKIRVSAAGTADTSSTALIVCQSRYTGASGSETDQCEVTYNPGVDETLSILLTVALIAGTGPANISGAATTPIELWVDDMGVDPGNTGVAL